MTDDPGTGAAAATSAHVRATDTMRRVLIAGPGSLDLQDVPAPVPAAGEVRVRVVAAGICGSDLELLDGARPASITRYPVQPGHEWVGVVDAVGPDTTAPLPGTPVVATGIRGCGTCRRCLDGWTNLCERGYAETGFTEPGAFAEMLTLPARLVHELPADLPDLASAALLEPAACVAGALFGTGAVVLRPGATVAVVGTGTLGLLAVQMAAACSPAGLVAVGPGAAAGAARRFGATDDVDIGDDDAVAAIGADVVVEASADPVAHRRALDAARPGGVVVLGGIPASAPPAGDDLSTIVLKSLTVAGFCGAPAGAWKHAIALLRAGVLDLPSLVSHRLPLTEAADAFALMRARPDGLHRILLVP